MILDFWNTRLNPITMLPREENQKADVKRVEYKREVSTRYHLTESAFKDDEYIIAKEARDILGIGFKKINHTIKDITGLKTTSFYFRLNTYYKRDHIQMVLEDLKKEPVSNEIQEEYISSSDLKDILNIDTMQLFTLSSRHKWKKTKLKGKGNQMYYLRSQVLK